MNVLLSLSLLGSGSGCGDDGGGGPADAKQVDATQDAPPNVARSTLFLLFEGVTLMPGLDDATTNTSGIVSEPRTMTPYMDDQADRTARIAAVTASVQTILAPFNVEVVSTRPSSGAYNMIVLGGAPQELGFPSGVAGVAAPDCANSRESPIVVLFGDTLGPSATGDVVASVAVAGFAVSNGIPSSNKQNDCACWSGQTCAATMRCTMNGAGTPVADGDSCAMGQATMDTLARFTATFGAAP